MVTEQESTDALIAAGIVPAKNEEAPAAKAVEEKPEAKTDEAPKDEPLGDGGLKALQAERDARKTLDAENKRLNDRLNGADKALTELKTSAAQATTDATRYKIAWTHKLTQEDLEALPTGLDEDALEKLAARLASKTATPMTPNPTQGANKPAAVDKAEAFRNALFPNG